MTKDKKPTDEKVKDTGEVIPPRPETPKLFKAALEVATGQTLSKLKETYKGATLEVFIIHCAFMILLATFLTAYEIQFA